MNESDKPTLQPTDPRVMWGANVIHCQHDIQPAPNPRERGEFHCAECKRLFPQSLIEEVDGKYRMMDFSKCAKGPGRSRR